MADEHFRVFRVEGEGLAYIGTFAGTNAKDAIKKAVWEDEPGEHVYEAHVCRNASLYRVTSRAERFIDAAHQLNTQAEMSKTLQAS